MYVGSYTVKYYIYLLMLAQCNGTSLCWVCAVCMCIHGKFVPGYEYSTELQDAYARLIVNECYVLIHIRNIKINDFNYC